MSSNKYDELLERYYNGLTSVEEERWLKSQPQWAAPEMPMAALAAEKVEMDWSFEDFKRRVGAAEKQTKVIPLRSVRWWTYAAAILLLVLLGIGIYTNNKMEVKVNDAVHTLPRPAAPAINDLTDTVSRFEPLPVKNNTLALRKKTRPKKNTPLPGKNLPAPKNDDFFVMVNGRRITNEEEALAILQQSLGSLSGDMRETMAAVNNSPKLNFKLK